jgi:hypothetical protein
VCQERGDNRPPFTRSPGQATRACLDAVHV